MEIVKINFISPKKSNSGSREMSTEILDQLKNISTNEKGKEINFNGLNLREISLDSKKIEESNYLLFEKSRELIERNFKTFFIGKDHSINYPIGRAFEKTEENPLLIIFDAHADCSASKSSCFNRRWLRKLIEESFFGSNVILISTRNLSGAEIEFIKQKRITLVSLEVIEEDRTGVCDLVMERARKSGSFFLSIDMDCVDPGFAPGAVDLEPGGLSSRDLIYFVKRLALLSNFKGAVISEIDPSKDLNQMTVKLGAKLLAEMI
jgi:formiminoglutamase